MNHISWNMTKECNLDCKHCYRDSGPGKKLPNELTTLEGEKLIREVSGTLFNVMVFSGGEPLLRDDIFHLAKYADNLKLIPALGTNGTLITPQVARQIHDSNIRTVAISLDSIDPAKHDSFRGVQNSFNMAVEGIKNCVEADVKVQVSPTVTTQNKDEILQLIDFISSLGASSCHVFFLVDTGRGKNLEALTIGQYKKLINDVLRKETEVFVKPTCAPQFMVEALYSGIQTRLTRGCTAGISYCCILPNGDVQICPYTSFKIANVREESFDKIWKDNPVFKELRNPTKYQGKCGTCRYIKMCGGCRARALSETGNYMGSDPYCLLGVKEEEE